MTTDTVRELFPTQRVEELYSLAVTTVPFSEPARANRAHNAAITIKIPHKKNCSNNNGNVHVRLVESAGPVLLNRTEKASGIQPLRHSPSGAERDDTNGASHAMPVSPYPKYDTTRGETEGVGVCVAVKEDVLVAVCVRVDVPVLVSVDELVDVEVRVLVEVRVDVAVRVRERVLVLVRVDEEVEVPLFVDEAEVVDDSVAERDEERDKLEL